MKWFETQNRHKNFGASDGSVNRALDEQSSSDILWYITVEVDYSKLQ